MDIPSGDNRSARFPQKDLKQPPASPNLQLSEELYRLLIETMNDGLVVIDHQLHFAYVNQKFCDLLGYAWDELANQPMASFLDATNQAIFEQQVTQRRQGLKSTYELYWNTKHGTPIITLVSGSPIHRNGEFAGSFGVITDITERKRAEEERAAHLRFFEGLDRVNRTMQAATDLDQMMRDVLDVLLSIFDCDRAWLVYPCDPDAPTWQVPMERTRPEYPGVLPIAVELPLDPVGAAVYRILRDSPRPVQFHAAAKHPVPIEMMQGFNVQSIIAMAFYPKIGKAWSFGLHQCSYPRIWTPDEERLFETIGNRLSDTLSSLLTYRNLLEREQHSQSLLRLSKNLEAAQTYHEVINTARDEIRTILGYQNLWVYLLTEDKQFCHLLLAEGHIAEKITTTKDIATLTIKGDPMLEAIAGGHEIIVVEDARTDPRTNKEIVTQLGNRTIVNVPIILLDQHLGSVGTGTFGDEGVRVPTESEKEYLTAMASHLAVALQRIHLLMQRKQADKERTAHLRYFEGMDQVNRAIQGTNDLDQMMRDVLNTVLSIFACDRAWLVYPCDPQATSLQVKMEQTRPEYPGALVLGVDIPITPTNAYTLRYLLESPTPVTFGPGGDLAVPDNVAADFGVQSYIAMALYPKTGKPWQFGIHQCSYLRVWSDEEKRLFEAVGRRLSDALSSLLAYHDLQTSEENLRQSNNLLQTIIEAAPTAIIGIDLDGNVQLVWNPAAEKMLGWTAAEAMGNLLPSVQRENQEQFKAFRDRIRRGESLNGVEVTRQKRDGTPIDYSIYASPLYDANGLLMGNIAVLVDITERKRAQSINQARLRLLEVSSTHSMDELLTATLDEIEELTGSAIGFYHFLQPDQKTLSLQNWSTNTLKTLCTAEGKGSHYPVDQAGVWVDCVHERRPIIHNDYASLPHRKGLPEGHAPVIRQAVVPIFRGNLIEAIIGVGNKATPYNDNDIEIISQLGDLSWDITERKRAEEALQKQYSTLRGIMENANALIFSVDRDYQYTSFNQAHAATMQILYGVEIEIGQSLLGYMNVPEDREIAKNNLDRALAGERHIGDSYSGEELRSRRYFQVSHSPIQTEAGAIVGVVVLAQDITERKEMERKLEESEKRLRLTLEATQIGVWDWNIECDEWYASPVYYTMLGYEPKAGPANRTEWLGRVHPDDLAEVGDMIDSVLTRQFKDYEYEARMRHADGTYHWQYVKGFGIERDANGKVTRMLGIRMDITERKRAAEALRQSEQQFRLLAENSTDMITRHSPDGTYLYASPACTSLLGYHPDDLIGHSAYEFFHPDDVPAVSTSHATILTEPAIYTVQYRIRHKDGHYVWFETTSKTILDKQTHTITEIQAASRDITERKQAEFALQHYSQRLATLHQIDRHILKAQSPHDITNTVLEQLIHLIPCEWAGILLHNTTATEARMYALQHLPDTSFPIEKKYAVLSNEAMLQLQLGHSITIPDLQTAPGPHAELNQQLMAEGLRAKLMTPLIMQDQLIGVLILASHQMGYFTEDHRQVAEEIAAQLAIAFHQANLNDQIAQHTVELERRVRERTTELEHVNRELEAFSYSVSHDLRAPLRAIEGFAEIIARRHRDTLNDEGLRYFDNIVQASEQMNQLIGDLLTYARLGRQRQGLLRLVTLDPILAEVQTNLAPLIAEKGGQINIPTHLPAVRGDTTLLKQIFTNLVENALVYHRPEVPPVVTVTCTPEDHAVLMVVEDNGIGIPPEFKEKVFGIFQRLHGQEQYPGTGIGLAIVRKTVEMLGGEVWIEDAAVQGTRFCIKLLTEPEKDR